MREHEVFRTQDNKDHKATKLMRKLKTRVDIILSIFFLHTTKHYIFYLGQYPILIFPYHKKECKTSITLLISPMFNYCPTSESTIKYLYNVFKNLLRKNKENLTIKQILCIFGYARYKCVLSHIPLFVKLLVSEEIEKT